MMCMKNTKILDGLIVFNCTYKLKGEHDKLRVLHSQLFSIRGTAHFISCISDLYTESDSTSWRICNIDWITATSYYFIFYERLRLQFWKKNKGSQNQNSDVWKYSDGSEYSNSELHWKKATPPSGMQKLVHLVWMS